jgi:hypothetical protein
MRRARGRLRIAWARNLSRNEQDARRCVDRAAFAGAIIGHGLASRPAYAGGPCYSNAHYSQSLTSCNSLGSEEVRNCTASLRQDHNTYNPTTTPHGSAAAFTLFDTYKSATGESVNAGCPGSPTTNGWQLSYNGWISNSALF